MANQMSLEPNAILAINSLDRYIATQVPTYGVFYASWFQGAFFITWDPTLGGNLPIVGASVASVLGINASIVSIVGNIITIDKPTTNTRVPAFRVLQTSYSKNNATAPTSGALFGQYNDLTPYSNNFTIQSPNALIYGYITKIIVSQIQVQYNIPTVNLGKNDTFTIVPISTGNVDRITIPHGFYYADELAATIQVLIRAVVAGLSDITVVFDPRDGFIFTAAGAFYFPTPDSLQSKAPDVYTNDLLNNIYKTYRLLGITSYNSGQYAATKQISYDYPTFLYTPYIDIYSDVLTNYQRIKDTNTSVAKPKGLIARVYVSGTGQIQTTGSIAALGTSPYVMTADLNTPKVIRWDRDVAVPSVDFQLLDQYGELIPGAESGHSTEFQMTLLCIEGN